MAGQNHFLDLFFAPRSIALVGVTTSFGFGSGLPRFMIRYGMGERLYLVNPNVKEIEGHPVYRSVKDIPQEVDLACILVSAPVVSEVLRECLEKGVRAVIVMSAGFAETGQDGRTRQEELARMARAAGARLLGPNCVGVVNVPGRFATCEVLLESLSPGSISVIAQSGVFGNILLDWAPSQGIPIAKVATIGNRADVDEADLLEYFRGDIDTRVIVLYLESLKRPQYFLDVARRTSLEKPILVYLGGETDAGRRATMSHTGSLGGSRPVEEGVLRQAGICMARDPVELFDMARAFAFCPLPEGNRILVVTASGSLGVMAADTLLKEGMSLPLLSEQVVVRLREKAPAWMNVGNPLDVGPSGLFNHAMEVALMEPGVDGIVAFPIIPWAVVSALLEAQPDLVAGMFVPQQALEDRAHHRPVIISVLGHPAWKDSVARVFGPRVSMVSTPQTAARAMAVLYRYKKWREMRGALKGHTRSMPNRKGDIG